MQKLKVLVLCTGNSCRSQMLHGYLQFFGADKLEVYSAGVEVHGLNPIAVGIMAEDGINIMQHTSNHIDDYRNISFDFVITVCDSAVETCPWFPAKAQMIHHSFKDPAGAFGSTNQIINEFRSVRADMKSFALTFVRDIK
jgi:arsenate reductase (thioredoxin)